MLSKTCLLALGTLAAAAPQLLPAPQPGNCDFISRAEARRINFGFNMGSIFPGIVPGFTPLLHTNVTYGQTRVDVGNTIPLPQTLMSPTYVIGAEPNYDPATTKYFLLMLDPDAPSPNPPLPLLETVFDDFLHLAVQDLQPACVANQAPQVVRQYLATTPLSADQHRYIFLVLRQPPGFQTPAQTRATIFHFSLGSFMRENNLTIVGGSYFKQGLTNLS